MREGLHVGTGERREGVRVGREGEGGRRGREEGEGRREGEGGYREGVMATKCGR